MKIRLLSILTLSLWAPLSTWANNDPEPANANDEAPGVADLCNTYADEDKVSNAARDTYIQNCLKRMTFLSDSVIDTIPLVSDGTDEPVATPSTEKLDDPEQAIEDEMTTTPDPQAEQLDAEKK